MSNKWHLRCLFLARPVRFYLWHFEGHSYVASFSTDVTLNEHSHRRPNCTAMDVEARKEISERLARNPSSTCNEINFSKCKFGINFGKFSVNPFTK